MDDAELAPSFNEREHELSIHATERARRSEARRKAAYRDGIDEGQEAVMQAAFDAGYQSAAEIGRICGHLRGLILAAAAVRHSDLPSNWRERANAVLGDIDAIRLTRVTEPEAAHAVSRLSAAIDAEAAAAMPGENLLHTKLEPHSRELLRGALSTIAQLLAEARMSVSLTAIHAAVDALC